MPVYYDTEAQGFAIAPDHCPDCGNPLYDTGCDAAGCAGRCCMNCGTGCDIETVEDGACATALAEEDEAAYNARLAAERAAFGLPPLTGKG